MMFLFLILKTKNGRNRKLKAECLLLDASTATSMIIKQLSFTQNVAEFYSNNNPSLVISSNGYIGINKINGIQERLDIDGNIKIKGKFTINSNLRRHIRRLHPTVNLEWVNKMEPSA